MKTFCKIAILSLVVVFGACSKRELNTKVSNTTAWNYFDERTTNFEALEGVGNVNPVGMVPIQGGTFALGENDEFITAPRNNPKRSVTVSSFYMDKYEITNLNWREYLHWMEVVFSYCAPELVAKVLPDTTVWREELAYNEPYVENYFRHPAFSFYPVVGVSWDQAMDYCSWRTDRVNELALIKAGVIDYPAFSELLPIDDEAEKDEWEEMTGYEMVAYEVPNPNYGPDDPEETVTVYRPSYEYVRDKFVFNTEKYLSVGDYKPTSGRRPKMDSYGSERKVNRADGILVVGYRLPTEAEWEFAAYAPIAGEDGLTVEGKVYPWSGYHPRNLTKKQLGQLQANFVRGRGDMMGVSGALNDKYVITAPVDAFMPNDFGLYNMAGNVNEWVMDVYRETSFQEIVEYNSYRGNIYTRAVKNDEGVYEIDSLGRIAIEWTEEKDDKRDFRDGDLASRIKTDYPLGYNPADSLNVDSTFVNAKYDPTDILAPQISKKTRVYKGGSWHDRVYWLNPSTRRYLDQDRASSTVGFRCAMSTLGDQIQTGTGK